MLLLSSYFSPNNYRGISKIGKAEQGQLLWYIFASKKKRFLSLLSLNHCFDFVLYSSAYTCPYIDYSNRTYEILCHIYDQYTNVTITLTCLDFGAYRWYGRFINKTI